MSHIVTDMVDSIESFSYSSLFYDPQLRCCSLSPSAVTGLVSFKQILLKKLQLNTVFPTPNNKTKQHGNTITAGSLSLSVIGGDQNMFKQLFKMIICQCYV